MSPIFFINLFSSCPLMHRIQMSFNWTKRIPFIILTLPDSHICSYCIVCLNALEMKQWRSSWLYNKNLRSNIRLLQRPHHSQSTQSDKTPGSLCSSIKRGLLVGKINTPWREKGDGQSNGHNRNHWCLYIYIHCYVCITVIVAIFLNLLLLECAFMFMVVCLLYFSTSYVRCLVN